MDIALETNGKALFTFPFANQDFDVVGKMLSHQDVVLGLADSGAHCGQIMDASLPTYFLSYWVREKQRFTLQRAIEKLTSEPARLFQLEGRGVLKEGAFADINVIDLDEMRVLAPGIRAGLPGRRLALHPARNRRPAHAGERPALHGARPPHRRSGGQAAAESAELLRSWDRSRARSRSASLVGDAALGGRAHAADVLRERAAGRLERRRRGSAPAGARARRRPPRDRSGCVLASIVIVSPSSTSAIGPPSCASGVTCPTMKPCEPPEKRPSVTSATRVAQPGAHQRRGGRQHLGHAGPALRALVADHDHAAARDPALLDGGQHRLFLVEDLRRPGEAEAFLARELGDRAVRREAAAQDLDVAGRLDRIVPGPDHRLALREVGPARRGSRPACGRCRSGSRRRARRARAAAAARPACRRRGADPPSRSGREGLRSAR